MNANDNKCKNDILKIIASYTTSTSVYSKQKYLRECQSNMNPAKHNPPPPPAVDYSSGQNPLQCSSSL